MLANRSRALIPTALLLGCALLAPSVMGASTATKTISRQDQGFVNKAWNINTAEVSLGQVALKNASNADVKTFGQRMIDDHTKLNDELTTLVESEGGKVPSKLNKENQHLVDKLSKLSGAKFDKEYMNTMIKGHHAAVALFEKESKDSAQTAVDKWAGETVAMLRTHLQLAEKTGKEVGASAASEKATVAAVK